MQLGRLQSLPHQLVKPWSRLFAKVLKPSQSELKINQGAEAVVQPFFFLSELDLGSNLVRSNVIEVLIQAFLIV